MDYDLPYIEWRVLIGLWLMVILLVLAVAELTFLVHYFTRFSEEVFIGITGFFFFYEACLSIIHVSSGVVWVELFGSWPERFLLLLLELSDVSVMEGLPFGWLENQGSLEIGDRDTDNDVSEVWVGGKGGGGGCMEGKWEKFGGTIQ